MHSDKPFISSTLPSERIVSLDVLRGFAVLGILIMNIQSMSMISAAYINPTAYGDLTGINKWVWILSHLFAAEKFMSIFSMLFGAGIVLFTERAIAKGRRAGPLHYRRNFWLLLFGLVHAYLIWYGDILVAYSLCGFLVFVFRNKKPRTLVIVGSIFFIVPMLIYGFFAMTIQYWPEEAYNQNRMGWLPPEDQFVQEINAMRGNWLEQMDQRVFMAIFMQTFLFFMQVFWRVTALMLLGMAFYKWGILSAKRSRAFYVRMVLISLPLGYIITGIGVQQNFAKEWFMDFSMFLGFQFNYVGSVATAFGYIGLVMLLVKSSSLQRLKNTMSAVGKMAFTNYILMSVIGTLIFYGHGFGYFGKVERLGQILIVPAVWIGIILFSVLWQKKFQYGPLEWLWRTLTYWRKPAVEGGDAIQG